MCICARLHIYAYMRPAHIASAAALLQAGAMGEIEVDAKNRIALRTDAEFASIRSKVSELEHKLSGFGL